MRALCVLQLVKMSISHLDASSLRQTLAGAGVLPVAVLRSADGAAPLCEALLTAGCPAVEITLRTDAGLAALPLVRAAFPDLLLGAGTVRTPADLRRAVDAGAQFLVSPHTSPELIELALDLGVPLVPGACTPTEIDLAVRAGAGVVKFFPAEVMGGTRAVAAIGGPFPDVPLMPTGGVSPANLAGYLSLPNVVACGGSWLASPELLAAGRFDAVTVRTKEALAMAAGARALVPR